MDAALRLYARLPFYHAIHLADFEAYCHQGALLSRALLATAYPGYTRFYSDVADQARGYWPRTFGNVSDFGDTFWRNDRSAPCTYGPITLCAKHPQFWMQRSDTQFTRRSVASPGFSPDDLLGSEPQPEWFEGNYLRNEYGAIEVSFGDLSIRLSDFSYIIVDPIHHGGHRLVDVVRQYVRASGAPFTARQVLERKPRERHRPYAEARKNRLEHLLRWAQVLQPNDTPSRSQLEATVPPELQDWYGQLGEQVKFILAVWLRYVWQGTLRALLDHR